MVGRGQKVSRAFLQGRINRLAASVNSR